MSPPAIEVLYLRILRAIDDELDKLWLDGMISLIPFAVAPSIDNQVHMSEDELSRTGTHVGNKAQ